MYSLYYYHAILCKPTYLFVCAQLFCSISFTLDIFVIYTYTLYKNKWVLLWSGQYFTLYSGYRFNSIISQSFWLLPTNENLLEWTTHEYYINSEQCNLLVWSNGEKKIYFDVYVSNSIDIDLRGLNSTCEIWEVMNRCKCSRPLGIHRE